MKTFFYFQNRKHANNLKYKILISNKTSFFFFFVAERSLSLFFIFLSSPHFSLNVVKKWHVLDIGKAALILGSSLEFESVSLLALLFLQSSKRTYLINFEGLWTFVPGYGQINFETCNGGVVDFKTWRPASREGVVTKVHDDLECLKRNLFFVLK